MSHPGAIHLFTVTDRFSIPGRGTVLAPGIPRAGGPIVRRGDPLLLRTPSGDVLRTTLREVEMIGRRLDGAPILHNPILLDVDIRDFDIPPGTEVFLDNPPGNPPESV